MGVKGLSVTASTISWLRDYLTDVGPINSYGFYKYVQQTGLRRLATARTEDERERARAYLSVSYNAVRKVFWMLRIVGGIEFDHEQPSRSGAQPRRYYRIADRRWFVGGLQQYFWPKTALGGTRYAGYKRRGKEPPVKSMPAGISEQERPVRPV